MKRLLSLRCCLLALAAFALPVVVVRAADDLGAIKARIEGRLHSIVDLKRHKLVGEDNRGYLEARGNLDAAGQRVVSEENADRGRVYQSIAAQEKTTSEQVGRQRALQIGNSAERGTWLQGADGKWYEK